MFVDIATANPNAIAATQAGISLTYHELNLRADQVATALRSRGLQAGSIVGVCVPRSFEMLIGIMGVLKAGAAYLPLDIDYPESYLSFVLADADVQFVLANSRSGASLPKGKYLTLMFEDIA